MALIRAVLKNTFTNKWAYVEFSDEDEKLFTIMGNQEFDDEETATKFSKGFEADSYEYNEPKESRIEQLEKDKARLLELVAEIDLELEKLKDPAKNKK